MRWNIAPGFSVTAAAVLLSLLMAGSGHLQAAVAGSKAWISHHPSTAAPQGHALTGFHSVGALDVVSATPARSSVATNAPGADWNSSAGPKGGGQDARNKPSHHAPLIRLATNGGEKSRLASQGEGKPMLAPGANLGALQPVPLPNLEYADDAVRFALRETRALLDSLLTQPGAGRGELANAFGETGLLYHAHLAFEPARVCYRNAAILAPDDFRWPYYLAFLHQQNGRLEQAVVSYAKALDLQSDLDAARLRLGQNYLELGQWAQAGPLLEGLAGVPEFRGAALFGAGKLAYARQKFEQARDLLERAIAASPRASRIHYTLALTYRALGDLDRARYHLSRRGDTEPRFPDPLIDDLEALTTGQRTLFHSAMNAVYQGEYALAVRVFREGLRLDPDNLNARVSLARSLYLDGDRDGAEAELKALLSQAPERPLANFLLGALYQETGLSEQAMARYRAALRVEPEHPGANFLLANSLSRLGDYAQAARHYELSLRQEPDNKHARLREVLALIKGGAAHRTLRERLETAHAREPGDSAFAFLLAALLAASPDQAVRDGKRALALAAPSTRRNPRPQTLNCWP